MSHTSLRVIVRFSFLVVAASILLSLTTCGSPSSTTPNPSDISNVGTISPSTIANSGATNVPNSLSSTKSALSNIPNTDPFLSDIASSLNLIGTQLPPLTFQTAVSKNLSSDVQSQLTKIVNDIKNFLVSKSLNETISLSGDSLGQYIKLTTATSAFSASIVTTDGGPLNTSSAIFPQNFKSASGQATLSIVVDPQNLPPSSDVKDLQIRINAGGSITLGSTTVIGTVLPANLAFDYAESAVLAISFSHLGTGGKIVVTANAKNAATISDPASIGKSGNYSVLAPNVTVTISMYDDSGNQKYTQTWTDLTSLLSSLSS